MKESNKFINNQSMIWNVIKNKNLIKKQIIKWVNFYLDETTAGNGNLFCFIGEMVSLKL